LLKKRREGALLILRQGFAIVGVGEIAPVTRPSVTVSR
jgi:hypothetical protein